MTKRTERGQRRQAENGGGPDAGASGGADARRDVDHAPALARVGPCARAGRAGRIVSRGGGGAGGPQGPASTAAHPSSLGNGGGGAHLRLPPLGEVSPPVWGPLPQATNGNSF